MQAFEDQVRQGGAAAVSEVSRFFMQSDPVYDTVKDISSRLQQLGIPYAVIGGIALVAHGYRRTTEDVDLLVSPQDMERIHESLVGLGYRPVHEGGRHLRNTQTGVRVEFVLAGHYPGDGRPKPVRFPDPALEFEEIDGVHYISLAKLVELKLASGMTNPGRLRDLADVQELIRVLSLNVDFGNRLHPYVRDKFVELINSLADSAPADD